MAWTFSVCVHTNRCVWCMNRSRVFHFVCLCLSLSLPASACLCPSLSVRPAPQKTIRCFACGAPPSTSRLCCTRSPLASRCLSETGWLTVNKKKRFCELRKSSVVMFKDQVRPSRTSKHPPLSRSLVWTAGLCFGPAFRVKCSCLSITTSATPLSSFFLCGL